MCKGTVIQVVPTRFSAKEITMRCGSTSIYGTPIYCEECEKIYEAKPVWEYDDAGDDDRDPNWKFEPAD